MTKRELFDLLEDVPDDAEVFIMGADVGIVVQDQDGDVVLDEKGTPFEESVRQGYCCVLFDPLGQLANANAPWN